MSCEKFVNLLPFTVVNLFSSCLCVAMGMAGGGGGRGEVGWGAAALLSQAGGTAADLGEGHRASNMNRKTPIQHTAKY